MGSPVVGEAHGVLRRMEERPFFIDILVQGSSQEGIHQFQPPADSQGRYIVAPAVTENHGLQRILRFAHRTAAGLLLLPIKGWGYILTAGKKETIEIIPNLYEFFLRHMERKDQGIPPASRIESMYPGSIQMLFFSSSHNGVIPILGFLIISTSEFLFT